MYVIYEKETFLWFDFTADPSKYLNNEKYGFDRVYQQTMLNVYKKIGEGFVASYNPNEKKWSYTEAPISSTEKKESALGFIREYNIYLTYPLNERISQEQVDKLTIDLSLCADIVAANGESDLVVPIIDYI